MSSEHQPISPIDFDIQAVQHWIPDPKNPEQDVTDTLESIYDPHTQNPGTSHQIRQRLAKLGGLSDLQPGLNYSDLSESQQETYRDALDLHARVHDAALLENAEWNTHYVETHDPKTGLLNQGGLYEKLNRWTDLPEETLIISIDGRRFKMVNDKFGHGFGDTMISEIAALLKGTFRDSIAFSQTQPKREADLIAHVDSDKSLLQPSPSESADSAESRTGGDEYVIGILMDSDKSVDEYLAIFNQRINEKMQALFEKHRDRKDLSGEKNIQEHGFGLTLGAAVRKPGESIEQVIHRSDEAQLKNKDLQNAGTVGQVSNILLAED